MIISILKNHIAYHTYSGEVEVSLDFCPPGSLPPGNFLAKYVDHFDTVLLEPTGPAKGGITENWQVQRTGIFIEAR